MHIDPAVTYSDIEARHILQPLFAVLLQAGIANAISDARCLLGLVLGRDDPVLPHEIIPRWTPDHQEQLESLRLRRQIGEPISRLRGWREFWSMRFDVSPATLDPRPDSETVIAAATSWARNHRPSSRILDLGTGTGCLLLACLSELPQARGIGIDISTEAVNVATANADRHSFSSRAWFYKDDFAAEMTRYGKFDLILSNPPYIPSADIEMLDADVRHFDPLAALDGGRDGLDWWRILCPQIAILLANNGAAFVEIGAGQGKAVGSLGAASKLHLAGSFTDLSGHERCLHFQKEK
ncbi:MAG: peptide chain release factor N(5)-glutamine methyltransferase [Pseudomonadota bacterium]|nr:peptide chain release factor N(5)-glutamine methyltransferase [Pseudomonadota bacterium]